MPANPAAAKTFHDLHRDFLVLPNAWDAASAKIVELAGAKAVATSSAAVAWAHGYADGHGLPFAKLVTTVEEIARVVSLPITVDSERGYADDAASVAKNMAALIQAGGVGINLEDGVEPHEAHLKKIEAVRAAAEREGVPLYINARTDVYLKKLVPPDQALTETLRRARAIKNAGASGLFVPGLIEANAIREIASSIDMPLNIMAMPGVPKTAELKALGVKRVSAATAIHAAAMEGARASAAAFLTDGDSDALWARRGKPPAWNDLFKR